MTIFKIKLTAYFEANTDDYREYDDEEEIRQEYTPTQIIRILRAEWEEDGIDFNELLQDPIDIIIEQNDD